MKIVSLRWRKGRGRERAKATHVPALPPPKSLVLLDEALDAERHAPEPPEDGDDETRIDTKDDLLCPRRQPARGEDEVVEQMSEQEDGEPERGHVVVQVRHSTHDEERDEVQRPPSERELEAKDEFLPLAWAKIGVLALTAHEVASEDDDTDEETQTRGVPARAITESARGRKMSKDEKAGAPNDRVSNEVVLDRLGSPTAHSQAEVQERPSERRRSEDILLVRVGHERVVGRHHGDVEMPKVGEEGRFVQLGVSSRDWERVGGRGTRSALMPIRWAEK